MNFSDRKMESAPQENARFDFSPITERTPWRLPNGARVAVWVIPNIEHFRIDRRSTSIAAVGAHLVPDVLNYSWRDYGNRVGVWRMMEVMEKYGVQGTAALNADVCERYPQIIKAGNELEWEWMGHGENNSTFLNPNTEEDERALIGRVASTIARATGRKPRGWLSPALTETFNTPDLLAEAGFDYVANWCNDEQPYPMKVKTGALYSIPYSIEVNDITAFLDHHQTPEEFGRMICDQFDGLYETDAASPRVMAIALHPMLIGQPFRSVHFDRALRHIAQRREVWFAKGGDIIDCYKKSQPAG
jgi:peptidoglycan/xylan/chitin deacetylase (PgdA/CDA1 family)